MPDKSTPRPYEQWRTAASARGEDAAYTFGSHLITHARTEALEDTASAALPKTAEEFKTHVEEAVDKALHNVMALLEGFWSTEAGPSHSVQYALAVCVTDAEGKEVERIEISPSKLDLPVGYWQWKDGEFR